MAEAVPRLYLITPKLADAAAFVPLFAAALEAGDIACAFVRLQTLAASEQKKIVAALVPLAQKHETALLVEDPTLAARCDADGVHVLGLGPEVEAAVVSMKPDRIVGLGGLASRHEAMLAGESGADYLMFGGPQANDEPANDGPDGAAIAEILERTAWWAEIFTLPCVAYAPRLADVGPLAAAGADFIALGDAIWQHEQGAAAAVALAMAALHQARLPAHEPAP